MINDNRPSGKACPRDFFSVSEHVKYLEPVQLQAFEEAFANWKDAAKRVDSARARLRMWLIFLLLRHTGARLGEVLSLDDTKAFDSERGLVRLGTTGREREVPLPEEVCREIHDVLEGPVGCGARGDFFQVDPGYFRRICYARGKECGLPRDMAGPQVLRNTRAVEMLRSGVPITVVKEVLGQSSLNLTAAFQQFSPGDVASIMQRAVRQKTSARNAFVGHVVDVVSDTVMAEVVLETRSGQRLSSVITVDSLRNLKIEPGVPVAATVKAPLVNVVACEGIRTAASVRNRLSATILRVTESPVLAEVLGRTEDGSDVCALISMESARVLELKPGDHAEFWFKALSVVLNTV
ncbi:TOBE domain-containing protein [Pseudodesulfovibrio sp.]|uniref:TOBE domain-containing protein n=1 Tax=unclassified Pseudodesulfovibrio TaxID=2661612 RepID=UPI003B001401